MGMPSVLRLAGMVGFVTAVAAWSPAQAQEWTRFRGPNGQGVSEADTVPVTFSEADYNWKTKLPAGGHSSPVLWGKKIFLTCADDKETAERMVVCLHADDGRILWTKSYNSEFHTKHRFNSFASASPAVDANHVYICWSTPEEYTLLALDHDGKEVWRRDLGPFLSQHSSGTSPIVYQDMVILGNDQDSEDGNVPSIKGNSFLIAVDAKTGTNRWVTERISARVAYSTPCVYQPEGGEPQLIFNSQAHGISSINPKDGSLNWEIAGTGSAPLLDKRSVSSPVLVSGMITASCGSGGGGNYLVLVRPGTKDRKPELVRRFEQKDAAPYVPTPVAYGDLLFMWNDRGIASCVNAVTGEVHWVKRVGQNYFSSPIRVRDKIYCVSTEGDVVVVKAGTEYELLATNSLGEDSHSTPAVADGVLYLRTYNHLISVGGKK